MYDTKFFPGAKTFWYQGKWYDWQKETVHIMSHALHYGSSIFEGIRAYNTPKGPAIFRLDKHIKRFEHSAEVLGMELPYSYDELFQICKEVMIKNKLKAAYIRPMAFYSYGNLGLIPSASKPEVLVGAWQWGAYLGEETIQNGAKVLILPWPRIHISQIDLTAKIGGVYVQSQIGGRYARRKGYTEGLFLNMEGRIAEGPGENIIIIKGDTLKTNNYLESILEGITRTTILELAPEIGLNVEIGPIEKEELFGADEVFFTGTAAEVTPITRITDGSDPKNEKEYVIGDGKPGEKTRALAKLYGDVVRGKVEKYERYLTYVYQSKEEAEKVLGNLNELEENVTNY